MKHPFPHPEPFAAPANANANADDADSSGEDRAAGDCDAPPSAFVRFAEQLAPDEGAHVLVRVVREWERMVPELRAPLRGDARIAARIVDELAERGGLPAARISERVGADPSRVSRAVARLRDDGWVEVKPAWDDARMQELRLTAKGRLGARERQAAAVAAARHWLGSLEPRQEARIAIALRNLETAFAPGAWRPGSLRIRAPRAGDLGWIVERHGALFAGESPRAESGAAQLVARLLASPPRPGALPAAPCRERAFIAESGAERIGGVVLLAASRRVAQVRLLFAEPFTLGLGVERTLVHAATDFARHAGYHRIVARCPRSDEDGRRSAYPSCGYRVEETGDFALDLPEGTATAPAK